MKKYILLLTALLGYTTLYASHNLDATLNYRLHGQTRRFEVRFSHSADGSVIMTWNTERYLKMCHGSYTMLPQAVASASSISYLMPDDGNHITLPLDHTFAIISRQALDSLVNAGHVTLNNLCWERSSAATSGTVEARHLASGATMTVLNDPSLPLILSMERNPLNINWTATIKKNSTTSARDLIKEVPERSGGIYYAYPATADVMPPAPEGYRAAFISHYGRHGSRWLIKTWEYDVALHVLDSAARGNILTPLGQDVRERLKVIARQADGNAGALSPLGVRQHRGIAERLAARFPHLLATHGSHIEAFSSIEPRCIMSMSAFSERLKELNPSLDITRHASSGDMSFISYSNDEAKAASDEAKAAWWNNLAAWRDSVLNPDRLFASLFTNPEAIKNQPHSRHLMWILHDIAVDVQDVEPGVELLDIFTPDELYELWTALNYKMYYLHGNNPATNAAGPRSAANLLAHFVADIDSVAQGLRTDRVATLRFGHDTALLRLLALMNIEGADAAIALPRDYPSAWQDFNLTPMAANLQVILFTSTHDGGDEEEPLILLRLNEQPATLPLHAVNKHYYRWSDVKDLWSRSCNR